MCVRRPVAALQHYFVRMRKRSAAEAAHDVHLVLEEMEQRTDNVQNSLPSRQLGEAV
jgi:hypothetical protein